MNKVLMAAKPSGLDDEGETDPLSGGASKQTPVAADSEAGQANQALLKEMKLLDLHVVLEDLHISLARQDEEILSVHLRGLTAAVEQRPMDRDV